MACSKGVLVQSSTEPMVFQQMQNDQSTLENGGSAWYSLKGTPRPVPLWALVNAPSGVRDEWALGSPWAMHNRGGSTVCTSWYDLAATVKGSYATRFLRLPDHNISRPTLPPIIYSSQPTRWTALTNTSDWQWHHSRQ